MEQNLENLLDPEWYLATYPDVAAAGVDPLHHFLHHGQYEGRNPCAFKAFELEKSLWFGADKDNVLHDLLQLQQSEGVNSELAAWVLARWYASWEDWSNALTYAFLPPSNELALKIIGHAGPFLLAFEVALHFDLKDKANALLAHSLWYDSEDKQLARAMLTQGQERLRQINQIYSKANLLTICATKNRAELDCLSSGFNLARFLPRKTLITVIMPCYNAATTVATALKSLLAQSWRNLEIIVVDDASTDDSIAVVEQFQRMDKRVSLIRHTHNMGAYAARNTALAVAKGEVITTHDCDDWSHPQKLELQLKSLLAEPELMATLSHWVRCDPQLYFRRWRAEDCWIYRNVSSLMFRRQVHEQIGFWDNVSVGADTEFYYRLIHCFGRSAIREIKPGIPLSFGRAAPQSLTQQSQTHLRTQFRGVRKTYQDAADLWHSATSNFYMPAEMNERLFCAPEAICCGSATVRQHNRFLLAQASGVFDSDWYLYRYPDVTGSSAVALRHYLVHGEHEGRNPLPLFSASAWRTLYQLKDDDSAFCNAIEKDHDFSKPISIKGLQGHLNAPVIVVFAHSGGEQLLGAERSLVDVLQALYNLGYQINLVLPSGGSSAYIQQVQAYCRHIFFVPYQWWSPLRPLNTAVYDYLRVLIQQLQPSLVYVNTLVLWEPLKAARDEGVTIVMHVRELPAHDASLCAALAATPQQILTHIQHSADFFVANSQAVSWWLSCDERTSLIHNAFRVQPVSDLKHDGGLRVGMLSSNTAKKGLYDFVQLAAMFEQEEEPLTFYLFGPESPEVKVLAEEGSFPSSLHYMGFTEQPESALECLDVVLNLSNFQESFGRSVLEAMLAGRVVVAYRWGALPELIDDDSGFLVDFKDLEAVRTILQRLARDKGLLLATAAKAKARAMAEFSPEHMQQKLSALLKSLIK